jgi:antirestriction protein ArdC
MPKTKRLTNAEIAEQITDRLITELENGNAPWRKPWAASGVFHQNVRYFNSAKPRPYRGVNMLLLAMAAMQKGYGSPYWLTYKQATELATKAWEKAGKPMKTIQYEKRDGTIEDREVKDMGGVRKGEKSTSIVFWRTIKVDDRNNAGEKKVIPLARFFHVFNIEQCDGLGLPERESEKSVDPIVEAEMIINGWTEAPPVIHGGDRAYYNPTADRIGLPNMADFDRMADYYYTFFHEGVHATGHKDRLSRPEVTKTDMTFGDNDYSREELVAEIGSAILGAHAGLTDERSIENQGAYLRHWADALKADRQMVMKAASDAHKAADSILGVEYSYEEDDDQTKDTDTNVTQVAVAA